MPSRRGRSTWLVERDASTKSRAPRDLETHFTLAVDLVGLVHAKMLVLRQLYGEPLRCRGCAFESSNTQIATASNLQCSFGTVGVES